MREKYYWGLSNTEHAIKKAFEAGKPILAESDTIWGLFIPATVAGALTLDTLKKRRDKPYLVITDSLATVKRVALFPHNNASYELAQKGWPGPLTLLLPAVSGCLPDAQSINGVLGIRVPDHLPLRRLAEHYGPLFSTSANISGELVPTTYQQISSIIRNTAEVVIYNDPSHISQTKPSTIIDCTGTQLVIVRHGAYPV